MTVRNVVACVLAALPIVLAPGVASANDYVVTACDAAPGDVNNAWVFSEAGPSGQIEHAAACTATGEFGGIYARDRFNPPDSTSATSGYWTFSAPATTEVYSITYSRFLKTYLDDNWRAELLDSNGADIEQCRLVGSQTTCTIGTSTATFTTLFTPQLRFGVRCVAPTNTTCGHGATIHSVEAVMYGSSVSVRDPQAPTVGALTGTLTDGGWLRGTKTIGLRASDATGVKSLSLTRDDDVSVRADDRTCDYTKPAPCASPSANVDANWVALNTAALTDGSHTLMGTVSDAADNTSSTTPISIEVDNTAPAAPNNLNGAGAGWSPSSSRSLTWTLADNQVAPITGATVTLCAPGGACTNTTASSLTSATMTLPAPGTYTGSIYLTDAAANEAPATNGATFTLNYDPGAPPAPRLGAVQQQGTANDFIVPVEVGDPGPAPLTRLTGDLCRTDGDDCQPLAGQSSTTQVRTAVPAEGSWRLRVAAVDAAGNTGPTAETMLSYTVPAATSTPTVSPSPTPGPAVKRRPQLRITRTVLHSRTLIVRARTVVGTTGTVTVSYRIRVGHRTRTATRHVRLRHGRLAVTVHLPAALRARAHGRLVLRYPGDLNYRAVRAVRTVKRS